MADLGAAELDKLFCMNAKKFKVKKLLLKAIAEVESGMNQKAYRFEPGFWNKYLKDNPEWKDKDPAIVSASHGLLQIMWTTAWSLGFRGTTGEELEDPATNIMLEAKLIRSLIDKVRAKGVCQNNGLWEIEVATALYNGGSRDNPDASGKLRNQRYVDRVMDAYWALRKKERECDEA